MSKNRVLYALIVVALLAASAISLRQVMVTKAASPSQVDRSYDQIEKLRLVGPADRSFDGIESIRQSRSAPSAALQGAMCLNEECAYLQTSNYQPPQQSISCLDDECSYKLSNGQWVR